MSGPGGSAGPRSAGAGPPSSGMVTPGGAAAAGPASSNSGPSGQNLNQIVIDYLNKKGYSQTEAALRVEMKKRDKGGPFRAEDKGPDQYFVGFNLLSKWIDESLQMYRKELKRFLWPVFVYSFLSICGVESPDKAAKFYAEHSRKFAKEHEEDLKSLGNLRHKEHIFENHTASVYFHNKYRLTVSTTVYYVLLQFLQKKDDEGGSVIESLLHTHVDVKTKDPTSVGSQQSFMALLAHGEEEQDFPDEDEGIPGHNPGSTRVDPEAPTVLPRVHLGPRPMEAEMEEDVRDDLAEADQKNPPEAGQKSLIEELDQQIKLEPNDEAPDPSLVPLPKPLARDVQMEVQKIKEIRNGMKIPPRSTGVGPGVSVCMLTFHNTFDSVCCMDISGDQRLVAAGSTESHIRVWSMDGKPLKSTPETPQHNGDTSSSRRLIGHSGPVYAVSFSPAIASDDPSDRLTRSRFLLSSSGDKTVRLWMLDCWQCLVVYKGHDHPVWDIKWGPYGHYFLTGSHDHTARLWTTDNAAPVRILVGHDNDVDCVAFHPNNSYVFTASCDRTVRMWAVQNGNAVRMFTSHTGNITALACAPNGKLLASADDLGTILIWDIATGRRVKRMRGHAKGGIWSLCFSMESSLLVSGGADATVRVWDALQQTEGPAAGTGKGAADGSSAKADGAAAGSSSAASGAKKGKAKDATITPDQISAFPTKKSPVYKVQFTNMNLILAGGAFMP